MDKVRVFGHEQAIRKAMAASDRWPVVPERRKIK
jgi:hypothetical protein